MATIEIPDYLLEAARITPEELNAELATLTPTEAIERLEKISKSTQDFLLFITYELRTPVMAVIGYSDLLLHSNHRLTPNLEKTCISAIRESAQYVSREINAVFDMVRHEGGWLKLEVSKVKLNELIEQVVSTVSEHIAYKYERVAKDSYQILKPKFEYAIPAELPEIWVDRGRIERILIETLVQAVRIYDRTSESKIAFKVSCDDEWVILEIFDDGIGLPSHLIGEVPHLYPTNKVILEMHGGSMNVKNREDGGWSVIFTLPTGQKKISEERLALIE